MTEAQLNICYAANDCSVCCYGVVRVNYAGEFKGYTCGIKDKSDNNVEVS